MLHCHMLEENSFVIAIAGGSGAGKTDLVLKLKEKISDSSTLLFDDYKQNYDDFIKDLKLLRKGQKINHPINNEKISPNRFLIIEDPAGMTNFNSKELIDYIVYIDTPLEVSLSRLLLRAIYSSTDEMIESFFSTIGPQYKFSYKEEPTKLMHIVIWLLENYLSRHRQQYIDDRERQIGIANLILDGMKDTEKLAEEVLRALRNQKYEKMK